VATFRLDIRYDGRRFSGWASQPGKRTVQGELEEALGKVVGEPTRLTVAGRTDAGVHALGQVASFSTERSVPGSLQRALNSLTGSDLAVPAVTDAADGFDARRDARSRRYRYRLDTGSAPNPFEYGRTLHWPHRFDMDLAEECARMLVGVHDFTAFTPTDTRHRHFDRTILDAEWALESQDVVAFEIEADAFLRGMVRSLVGTMLEVAADRRPMSDFERLLGGASRQEAGDSMSPYGLYLLRVAYPPPLTPRS
jgi:tRNA pseudouridine38-40 synthase